MSGLKQLLSKQWIRRDGSVDHGMVEHCLKSNNYVQVGDIYIYVGSKPTIDSEIWFDDETSRPDDNDFETFKEYNMRRNKHLSLDETLSNGFDTIWIYSKWNADRTAGRLAGWVPTRHGEEPRHVGEVRRATPEEVEAIRQKLDEMRASYEKRLATYWKRYSHKVVARGY